MAVYRRTNNINRVYIGWTIGGAILVLLLSLSVFYTGRGTHQKSVDNATNAVTQPQQSR
ncbi:hypothetical protein [Nitrobacter hamburgensis]|uniref:hypothetical protein n=1 Tax=Nitrobacter hamburgensis TaxID=912 RepID=UPI0012EDCD4D|nr:hypothetical protein [Nitrobacter hamburgensis]